MHLHRGYVRHMSTSSPETSSPEVSRVGYALAYREARRGLEDQERSVMELRARAPAC